MREHVLGLRRDPYLSALMAAEMMKRDRAKIERRLGRDHHPLRVLSGAFLRRRQREQVHVAPRRQARSRARRAVFPAAAKANKTLFFAKKRQEDAPTAVAEVYDKLDEMIDERLDRYEDVAAVDVGRERSEAGP